MAAPVPIYVIALEHTHARRKAISERLGALGLSFTFINAVNGKNLAEDEIDNVTTPARQKYLPHPLSKGAIGAGLSHLDAWRKIAASDAPMALILEDDAILDKDMDDILHQLSLLEDRIDIVNLHFRGGRPLTDIARLSGAHWLSSCRYSSIGAESYVITRKAAAHLAKQYLPIIYEVDLFLNRWWDHGLHILTVNPPVVCEDKSPTTIGYPAEKAGWPENGWWHKILRRLNRIGTSFTKRRRYPAMIAAIKKRLSGTDLTSKSRQYNYRDLAQGATRD